MSTLRQIILCLSLLLCAQTAVAEIIRISSNSIGGLRLDTNAARTASGPRVTERQSSIVNKQQTNPQQKVSTASNAENANYSPSISDAVIGSLVLLLAVGAAGGLARAQRPSASRW
jgi:hypothetical protein